MKLLEINHVEKSFDDLNVLKDISLSVEDGEIIPSSALPVPENPLCCVALPCWRLWIAERSFIWVKKRYGAMKTES